MIYLNAGAGKSIREKKIIGIFDMDTSTVSSVTRRFLSEADKEKRTESPSFEIPKSFILYENDENDRFPAFAVNRPPLGAAASDAGKNTKVCFSQFSGASIVGRISQKSERGK